MFKSLAWFYRPTPVPLCRVGDVDIGVCAFGSATIPQWITDLSPASTLSIDHFSTPETSHDKFRHLRHVYASCGVQPRAFHISQRVVGFVGKTMLLDMDRAVVYSGDFTLEAIAKHMPKPCVLATSTPDVYLFLSTAEDGTYLDDELKK